ncbi:MAG: 5-formyltetrahydrofolate cyclo-ligase [bacterium]
MNIVFQHKQEIRQRIEKQRRRLPKNWIESKSCIIIAQLKDLPEFQTAQTIHCYLAWRNEVNTHELIKEMLHQGRRVVVPVVDLTSRTLIHSQLTKFEHLKAGTFGILEPPKEQIIPVKINELDLIVVPGVAFDRQGNRIGFGGGYYDEFLKKTSVTKIGLAFNFQIFDTIPTRNQDERVDLLINEKGVHRFGRQN